MRTVRGDRGQATVEFALILPLLLIVAIVLVHIGVGLAVQVQVEAAAREGARAAAVEPASAVERAEVAARRTLGSRAADVSTTVEAEWVVVEVQTEVTMIPFVGSSGRRTLQADAVMRREDLIR